MAMHMRVRIPNRLSRQLDRRQGLAQYLPLSQYQPPRFLVVGLLVVSLLLLSMGSLKAQPNQLPSFAIQQVVPNGLIPNGSLGRMYSHGVFEKPGDINKTHIRVLALQNDRGETVGLKVAGHSEYKICAQMSGIVMDLALALEKRGATFGSPTQPDHHFVSYGLFEGPIDRKYRREYDEALAAIRQVPTGGAAQPTVSVYLLSEKAYRQQLAAFQAAEETARSRNQPLFVFHECPEPFMAFLPQGELAGEVYEPLFAQVKQTANAEFLRQLKADEQRLVRLQDALKKLELPSAFESGYQNDGTLSDAGEGQTQRLNQLLDELFASSAFRDQRALQQARLEQARALVDGLEEKYLQEILGRLLTAYASGSVPDTLRPELLTRLTRSEQEVGAPVETITLKWKQQPQGELAELIERYLVSRRTFIEFSEGMAAQHPHMLTDAVVRGWPVFPVEAHKLLYADGAAVRSTAKMSSGYHFLAPRSGSDPQLGAQSFVTLSGIVLQIIDTAGQSLYVNLESFLEAENQGLSYPEVAFSLVMSGGLDTASGFWVQRHHLPGQPDPADIKGFTPFLNIVDLSEMPRDFHREPADSQLVQLGAWLSPDSLPLQPVFREGLAGEWFRLPSGDPLTINDRDPTRTYGDAVVRYGLARFSREPAAPAFALAGFRAVAASQSTWQLLRAFDLPDDARSVADVAASLPTTRRYQLADRYLELQFAISEWATPRLPDANPEATQAQRFQHTYDRLAKAIQHRYDTRSLDPQVSRDLTDFLTFSRDIIGFTQRLNTQGQQRFRHDPDPNLHYLAGDPQSAPLLVTSCLLDDQVSSAEWLAVNWATQVALVAPSDAPADTALIGQQYRKVLALLLQAGGLDERTPATPAFQARLLYGLLAHAAHYAERRPDYPRDHPAHETQDAFVQRVLQPVLLYALTQAEALSLPDTLDFSLRNLRLVLESLPRDVVVAG